MTRCICGVEFDPHIGYDGKKVPPEHPLRERCTLSCAVTKSSYQRLDKSGDTAKPVPVTVEREVPPK